MKYKANTFVIRIVNNQHSTWQGTVTWLEKNEVQSFRSTLELLKMVDTVVGADSSADESVADESVADESVADESVAEESDVPESGPDGQ